MRKLRIPIVVLALVGCGGELIRLGDGPLGTDTTSAATGTVSASGGRAAQAGAGGTLGTVSTAGGRAAQAGEATASSGAGGASSGGSGGTEGATTCPHGQVNASEVLWIGDSWIIIPGNQHTRVRDLARTSGAIGMNDDYVVAAAAASTLSRIVDQYDSQEAGYTKVKVIIMDGGTWDTYLSSGSDASITKVRNTFEQFLAKVASDGTVEHIVYYLVPELTTVPGIAELRPHLQQACAESTVPCHFLDLQPLWAGHPDYTASDGIQASEAGAAVIADAIWSIMRENCIAQ